LYLYKTHASIGPCPFRHGKPAKNRSSPQSWRTSIGPCPFRHGKALPALPSGAVSAGFNWAMSFQTW